MKNGIDSLVEQWMSDDAFRAEFRSNPRAAAERRGIEIDAETLVAVESIQMTSGQLESRISMLEPTNGC
jgi:putative modified peptide